MHAIRRSRILAATLQVAETHGYRRLTVARIVGQAQVSRGTFYTLFEDRDHCFSAAFDYVLDHARQAMAKAFADESSRRHGIRSAMAVLLEMIDDAPSLARVCMVDALAADHRVLRSRAQAIRGLALRVGELPSARGSECSSSIAAEVVVGGALSIVHSRLAEGQETGFSAMLGSLMSIVVLPHLGPHAACEELHSRRGHRRARSRRVGGRAKDPLNGLNIRLTHRTVRVLTVIARHPGASNRSVAGYSGVSDAGQISKLLGRLARRGLIENRGAGYERGAPNAWWLTPLGAELESRTAPSFAHPALLVNARHSHKTTPAPVLKGAR